MDPSVRFAADLQTVLRRSPTRRELEAFSRYLSLLLKWNRVHSLTAYRKPSDILGKLFVDSLLFLPLLPARACQVLDLGSGAGVPGIPIKIIEPAYGLTLIEARRRRASFLSTVVRELGLQDVRVLTGRAETLIDGFPLLGGEFDVVLTRASGPLGLVTPLALRFLKPGGKFLCSGPPVGKPIQDPVAPEACRIVISPISGRPRRFFVIEKT